MFFFSCRRQHTRWPRDWSSDVCSSDLDPSDVIVRITTPAICGSDLHMYEGRTDAEPGITFGHENMGVIEEVGPGVTSLSKGDRVVLPFNVACGFRSEEHTSELESRGQRG